MNIRKKIYLITILCASFINTVNAEPKKYYVDATNGNDSWNGTQETASGGNGPWKSLNPVNSRAKPSASNKFSPGDKIFFKRGEVWNNQRLVISVSGSSIEDPITFGAYGSASERPVINGARQEATWTETPAGSGVYFWPHTSASASFLVAMYEDYMVQHLASDMNFVEGVFYVEDGVGVYYKPKSGVVADAIHRALGVSVVYLASETGTTDAVDYVHIRDLHLTMGNRAVFINPKGGSTGVELHDLTITQSRYGVLSVAATGQTHVDFVVKGLSVSDVGSGIELLATNDQVEHHDAAQIHNNTVYNIGIDDNFKSWSHIDEEAIGTQNLLNSSIRYNEIYQSDGNGSIVLWIHANSLAANNDISYNYIHDVAGLGIVAGSTNNTMANNSFHHNTIKNCGAAGGFRINKQAINNVVSDNVIISCVVNIFLNGGSSGWNINNNISINPIDYHIGRIGKKDTYASVDHTLNNNTYNGTKDLQFRIYGQDYNFQDWQVLTQDADSKGWNSGACCNGL